MKGTTGHEVGDSMPGERQQPDASAIPAGKAAAVLHAPRHPRDLHP